MSASKPWAKNAAPRLGIGAIESSHAGVDICPFYHPAHGCTRTPETAHVCKPVQVPTLLTARETASRLNVSLRKFEQMVHDGEGPRFARLGGVRRWDWGDVQVWLEMRKGVHA